MRGFVQNLAVKIISFILLVVLVFGLFAAAVGIYVLAENGVYYDGGEELLNGIYEEYTYREYYAVENMINDKLEGYSVDHYERELDPDKTNLRYTAVDSQGEAHGSNKSESDNVIFTRKSVINCFIPADNRIDTHYYTYTAGVDIGSYIEEFEGEDKKILSKEFSGYDDASGTMLLKLRYQTGAYREIYIEYGVLEDAPVKDSLYFMLRLAEFGIAVKEQIFIYAGIALLVSIILFIILMCGAGRKYGHCGVYLCKFHKIPFDLYLALNLLSVYVAVEVINEISYSDWGMLICFIVAIPLFTSMLLGLLMTFAARVKGDGWYKNTVIYFCFKCVFLAAEWLFKGIVYVVSKIPLFYKTLLVLLGSGIVEFMFLCMGIEDYIWLWIIEKLIGIPLIIYFVLCMRSLQGSAKRMAEGDTGYKVDTQYMVFDFKEHGETLNGIGNGLALAVEKSVKSERMKAELITNVSHDIKTPLTSIINYVDLLKKEGKDGDNAEEYIDVLERQAGRLKRLTEDLVEASKASTGNIVMTPEDTDINVLVTQAAAEYEERFEERGLNLVLETPEETLRAKADGRYLWRVFDNLMNNICKYAQPDTRVYITAKRSDERAEIVFKNVSREPLNIAPDELTERFVRGDRSRNTEGSGLGLSIAKSLTELQGGRFEIKIDGDLFKVTVTI